MVVALTICLVAPSAAATNKNQQVVEGMVRVPTPVANGSRPGSVGCAGLIQRNLAVTSGDSAQGYFGYHFDVSKKTWNHHFRLTTMSGVPSDLDIIFYETFGDAGPTAPVGTTTYGRPGDDKGVVPIGATRAIICMVSGADARFTYVAGPGVKG